VRRISFFASRRSSRRHRARVDARDARDLRGRGAHAVVDHQQRSPLHAGQVVLGHLGVDHAVERRADLPQQVAHAPADRVVVAAVEIAVARARDRPAPRRAHGRRGGARRRLQFNCHGSDYTA